MTTIGEPIRPIANIDDIVSVKGYGVRTFQVDAFTYEAEYDRENFHEEIYYDITCTTTFEYLIASQDDIAIVSRGNHAANFLQTQFKRPQATAHVPTTDELLDELSDALALAELFGEGDPAYTLRVDEIKAKLKAQVEAVQWQA